MFEVILEGKKFAAGEDYGASAVSSFATKPRSNFFTA